MQLYIIIPTYNEAENITNLIQELFSLPIPKTKILVVDDNSPDGTGQLVEDVVDSYPGRLSVLHRSLKKGLGPAYISGFHCVLSAGAEAVCQMDADFSHPPEMIVKLLDALKNCDVAMGSRYIPGGGVDETWPLWRKGLSYFGSLYARTILGLPIRDATGGFRIWRRNTLLGMPLDRITSDGYSFQIEMAYVAHRLGYSMQEIPFYFADRKWGQSKMSFRIQREAAIRVWMMLFQYRDLKKKRRNR